jgi:hypothetical protein
LKCRRALLLEKQSHFFYFIPLFLFDCSNNAPRLCTRGTCLSIWRWIWCVQVLSRCCRPTRLKCSYTHQHSHLHFIIASHFSIALSALKSLYISHLIPKYNLFPITPVYLTSAAFRKIAQGGGGVQGQGEYWCHGVVRC